ncbi:MAG: hypothetical protein Q7R96_05265, partial [Nanoarchaeota archaeon]|nr:hypothetical protein [Nanoarchaeota archaeon]
MVNYQQLNDNLERIGGAYAQFQARVTPADPGYVRGQARFATMVERALQNAGIDGAYIPMIMGEFQTKGIPMNEPDRVARILYAGGVCNDHLGASTQLGLQGNHQVADVVANDGRVTRRVVNEVGNRLGNEAARLRRGIIHETHGQGRMTRRAIDENRRAVTNALDQYGQENREAFDIVQNTTDGTYAAVGNLGRQVTALDGRVTALQTDTTNQYNTLNTGV